MRRTFLVYNSHHLICPGCEADELRLVDRNTDRCTQCGYIVAGAFLETLHQIATLYQTVGAHACECDHPEMRLLPDGVRHCPGCGSEVLPSSTLSAPPPIRPVSRRLQGANEKEVRAEDHRAA